MKLPSTTPTRAAPPQRFPIPAWVIWMLIFAALSATSLPEPFARKLLAPMGLKGFAADIAAHTIPVAFAALLIALVPMVVRGRSQSFRIGVLFVSGGLAGMLTSVFLLLFGRLEPLLTGWVGELRAPLTADIFGWALAALSVAMAVMVWAISVFGAPAARAISVQDCDPEDYDFRTAERQTFGLSAIGGLGQGICVGAIVLANQALAPSPEAKLALVAITVLGVVLFTWSSLRLWRDFDEMMRRVVMDAYAWSAILLTPVLVGWALFGALNLVPEMSAYVAFLVMIAVQTLCSTGLSLAKQGSAQTAKAAK